MATRERRLVLVIATAIFAVGLLSLFEPIYGEVCHHNEYYERDYCAPQYLLIALLIDVWRILNDSSVFLTAVATVGLVWVTIKLAKLESDSGETTKKELRAYVSATPRGIMISPDGKSLMVLVEAKNGGQTPAFNVYVPGGLCPATSPP